MYEKIKKYYDNNLWSKAMVRNAVLKNKISADEYKSITGDDYE